MATRDTGLMPTLCKENGKQHPTKMYSVTVSL